MMERSYGQCMIPCHKMTNFNFLMVMKIICRRLFSCAKGLIYAMSAESITLIWKMLVVLCLFLVVLSCNALLPVCLAIPQPGLIPRQLPDDNYTTQSTPTDDSQSNDSSESVTSVILAVTSIIGVISIIIGIYNCCLEFRVQFDDIAKAPTILRRYGDSVLLTTRIITKRFDVKYQWYKCDDNNMDMELEDNNGYTGSKRSTLCIQSFSSTHVGKYTCCVSYYGVCRRKHIKKTFTLEACDIEIVQQPRHQIKMYGEPVEFTVSATTSDGGDQRYLKYQWYFRKNGNEEKYKIIENNNSSYSGQHKPILVLKGLSFDHEGCYLCVVSYKSEEQTNEHGTDIEQQPESLTKIALSDPAELESCNIDIEQELNSQTMNRSKKLRVSDYAKLESCCINIDQQPESQTKMFGETVEFSFSATASDGGDQRYLKYQWYFKQKNGNEEATPYEIIDNNNSSYSGQDKPILRLKRFSFDHKGWYQCVISVKSGEHTGTDIEQQPESPTTIARSDPAELESCSITIESDGQPENQTRMYGETVLFAVSATASNEGDLNYLRYQWQCKTEGDDDFIPVVDKNDMNYSGAEKPTLKLKNFSSKHVGIYYCVIAFKFGGSESDCKNSNEVLLKSCDIQIENRLEDQTMMYGEPVTFAISASTGDGRGQGYLIYQWHFNGNPIKENSSGYDGINSHSLRIKHFSLEHVGSYFCVVRYKSGDIGDKKKDQASNIAHLEGNDRKIKKEIAIAYQNRDLKLSSNSINDPHLYSPPTLIYSEEFTDHIENLDEHKSEFEYDNLYSEVVEKKEGKTVIVTGRPGSGKSAFVNRIKWEWAHAVLDNSDQKSSMIPKSELLIVIELRHVARVESSQDLNTSATVCKSSFIENLYSLLKDSLPSVIAEANLHILSKIITSREGEGVVFLFDGYEAYPPRKKPARDFACGIILRAILRRAHVIVTSQPHAVIHLQEKCYFKLGLGMFSEQQIYSYVEKCIRWIEKEGKKEEEIKEKIEELKEKLQTKDLIKVCSLPLFSYFAVKLFKRGSQIPSDRAEIFKKFILYKLRECLSTKRKVEVEERHLHTFEQVKEAKELKDFSMICELALSKRKSDKDVFEIDDTKFMTDDYLGLVSVYSYNTRDEKKEHAFLHSLIQSYLAALHISQSSDPITKFLKHEDYRGNWHLREVWRFLSEMLLDKFEKSTVFKEILEALDDDSEMQIQCTREMFNKCQLDALCCIQKATLQKWKQLHLQENCLELETSKSVADAIKMMSKLQDLEWRSMGSKSVDITAVLKIRAKQNSSLKFGDQGDVDIANAAKAMINLQALNNRKTTKDISGTSDTCSISDVVSATMKTINNVDELRFKWHSNDSEQEADYIIIILKSLTNHSFKLHGKTVRRETAHHILSSMKDLTGVQTLGLYPRGKSIGQDEDRYISAAIEAMSKLKDFHFSGYDIGDEFKRISNAIMTRKKLKRLVFEVSSIDGDTDFSTVFETGSINNARPIRFGNYNERNEGKVDFLGVTKAIKDLQKLSIGKVTRHCSMEPFFIVQNLSLYVYHTAQYDIINLTMTSSREDVKQKFGIDGVKVNHEVTEALLLSVARTATKVQTLTLDLTFKLEVKDFGKADTKSFADLMNSMVELQHCHLQFKIIYDDGKTISTVFDMKSVDSQPIRLGNPNNEHEGDVNFTRFMKTMTDLQNPRTISSSLKMIMKYVQKLSITMDCTSDVGKIEILQTARTERVEQSFMITYTNIGKVEIKQIAVDVITSVTDFRCLCFSGRNIGGEFKDIVAAIKMKTELEQLEFKIICDDGGSEISGRFEIKSVDSQPIRFDMEHEGKVNIVNVTKPMEDLRELSWFEDSIKAMCDVQKLTLYMNRHPASDFASDFDSVSLLGEKTDAKHMKQTLELAGTKVTQGESVTLFSKIVEANILFQEPKLAVTLDGEEINKEEVGRILAAIKKINGLQKLWIRKNVLQLQPAKVEPNDAYALSETLKTIKRLQYLDLRESDITPTEVKAISLALPRLKENKHVWSDLNNRTETDFPEPASDSQGISLTLNEHPGENENTTVTDSSEVTRWQDESGAHRS